MDSIIHAAARALAHGDALGALDRVALRQDPDALALRGIAMAQLGDFSRARELLIVAARANANGEALAHARCVLALAEVDLALRDFSIEEDRTRNAVDVLEDAGDWLNAGQGRLVLARRFVLLGRVDAARDELDQFTALSGALRNQGIPEPVIARLAAIAALIDADINLRLVRACAATASLLRAVEAAKAAGIGSVIDEVTAARVRLDAPAARLGMGSDSRPVNLRTVETLFSSPTLVADACRHCLRFRGTAVSLATRPVLWKLALALAEAWPNSASRDHLRRKALEAKATNESWRTRLRVEVGRLRRAVSAVAEIESRDEGYVLLPTEASDVTAIFPPNEGAHGAVLALLSDGASWTTSSLALALDVSQRTVQRALTALANEGLVRSVGRGRARRWVAPAVSESATALLLPRIGAGG